MQYVNSVRWYHIIIICLILAIICLLCTGHGSNLSNAHLCAPETFNGNTQEKSENLGEVILYYTNWCGYSRSFLPEWDKFASYAKANMPYLTVTKLLCEDGNETVCNQKGVTGFPAVILYPTGSTEIPFNDARSSDKLIQFIKNNLKQ